MNRNFLVGVVLGASALLAACGGGGDSAPIPVTTQKATANLAVPATASLVSSFAGSSPVTVSFPNGFSGVDGAGNPVSVTGQTDITFTGGGATPAFRIVNNGATATGTTTFGSCIFTFAGSNFPASHPFGQGKSFKVDPCNLNLPTAGQNANGLPTALNGTFTFGNSTSAPFTITITISSAGVVTFNGVVIGTVNVTPVTGASS